MSVIKPVNGNLSKALIFMDRKTIQFNSQFKKTNEKGYEYI